MKTLLLFIACAVLSGSSFGQFSFERHQYILPGNVWASKLAAGDFNGDGRTDIITSLSIDNVNNGNIFYLFLQKNSGLFDSIPQQIRYPQICCGVISMTATDMDGDGLDDLITCSGDSIYIYYQSASHTLTPFHRSFYAGGYLTDGNIKIADIDHDGYKDLTMLITAIPSERILYGTGVRDSFTLIDYPQSGTNLRVNELGKVGTNTDISILHTFTTYNGGTSRSAHVMAEHINSHRQIDTTLYYNLGPVWQGITDIATLDRKANGNYAVMATTDGNWPNSTVAIWEHPGNPDTVLTIYDNADAVLEGDFRCDGHHEFVIAHAGYAVSVIDAQNQVDTMYADLPNNMDIGDMVLADMSGDGRLDIVLVNTFAGVTVLRNTTPVASDDSLIFTSHQISSDSTWITDYDSTFYLRDTLYIANSSMMIKTTILTVTHREQDTMRRMARSGLTFQNCHTDSIWFTDTIAAVSKHITNDSVYGPAGFDTIVSPQSSQSLKVLIYPNPFISGITIQGADSTARIEIYDQMGALALSENCGSNCFVSSDSLPQGIYTVKVIWPGYVYRKKVVSLGSF